MAEGDAGERTEQPTARRLSEAREQGRIARSTDLTAAAALLAGLLLLNAYGPDLLDMMFAMIGSLARADGVRSGDLLPLCLQYVYVAGMALLPFLGLLLVLTATGSLSQSGAVLIWSKLRPKLSELNPLKGVKRIASTDSLTRLGMGLLKMGILGGVAYMSLRGFYDPVLGAGNLESIGMLHLATHVLYVVALRLALVLLVLGLIDYFYQRWSLNKSLMMSKQEVKDEMKRMEGDPVLKSRRRQVQAKLAMQRIRMDVPKANVVVTNPTEYAVALRYDQATMSAPRVVAKGKDLLALHIRTVAQQHGVPIVQRPPLARALYAAVEVGGEVPPAYYRAVAELLAYVYQLSRRAATG